MVKGGNREVQGAFQGGSRKLPEKEGAASVEAADRREPPTASVCSASMRLGGVPQGGGGGLIRVCLFQTLLGRKPGEFERLQSGFYRGVFLCESSRSNASKAVSDSVEALP